MVGLVFLTSGWNHLRDPAGRSKDIGLSKRFTIFLGTVELAGSLSSLRSLLKCQHDGTRQNKAAAEPVMPRHVFAKNNRSQNNCKENTKFIHRSDARRLSQLEGAKIAEPRKAGRETRQHEKEPCS